jgi:hypothetical protein
LGEGVQSSHSGKNQRIIAILSAEGLLDTGVILTEISGNARGRRGFRVRKGFKVATWTEIDLEKGDAFREKPQN